MSIRPTTPGTCIAARFSRGTSNSGPPRARIGPATVYRTSLVLAAIIALAVSSGCASTSIGEEVIYPDRVSALDSLPRGDVADNEIAIAIDAPADEVWDALLTVLVQHAFISTIDTSNPAALRLGYVDFTLAMLDEKLVNVALPFAVTVEPIDSGSSAIRMLCRWDLVASDSYRNKAPERYEALKASMLGEGYMLVARVEAQATADDRWPWLGHRSDQ